MRIASKKSIIIIILICLIPLFLGGCWNRREVQDISINTGMGFDRIIYNGQPGYRVSILASLPAKPSGSSVMGTGAPSKGNEQQIVVSLEGKTVYDAVRNWNDRIPRQLFLSHVQVFVIGESLARDGIKEVMDFCMRHRGLRMRTWVVVANGSALDALQIRPEMENTSADEEAKLIAKGSGRNSKVVKTDLRQVLYDLVTPGKESVMPHLKPIIPPEGLTAKNVSSGSSGDKASTENKTLKKVVNFEGSAVFKGDRLTGWLSPLETQGLLILTGKADEGVIPVKFKSSTTNVSYVFRKNKSKIKPVIDGNRIRFEITLHGNGDLLEDGELKLDKTDYDVITKRVNREIERRCYLSIKKIQALNSDIMGLGNIVHRTQPEVWRQVGEQWDDIFPTIEVTVKASSIIEQNGMQTEAIKIR
ncbi:MAG: Ger(x)C family spore germination protein [Chitinophagales bacterium]